jgi:hypothetical protein
MSPRRALDIIMRVWGSPNVISAREVSEVEAVAIGDERILDTLCRVAGISLKHVTPFHPMSHCEIRRIVTERELALLRSILDNAPTRFT